MLTTRPSCSLEKLKKLFVTFLEHPHYFCFLFSFCLISRGEIDAEKDKVPTVFAEIRPDEIPDVPFQKFLFRGKQEEEVKESGDAK